MSEPLNNSLLLRTRFSCREHSRSAIIICPVTTVNMDHHGRMGLQPWASFDPKHNLREHPALKLMDMVAERDAAVVERDTAMADRKTAFAERESAFLQRDLAFAERNTACAERDAACMALAMVRAGTHSREIVAKLMQLANMAAVPLSAIDTNLQGLPQGDPEVGGQQGKQLGKKGSPNKRKVPAVSMSQLPISKPAAKKKGKQMGEQHALTNVDHPRHNRTTMSHNSSEALVSFFASGLPPIPHCSCTGANQQCYRWGNGGWQSACCTNFLSVYPLPMNPAKRSSRVPGRKMSANAFKKLLERLAGDGVDINVSIDLKNYWAKHGTNRYATIK